MEKKISISQIKEVAQEAYNEVKGSTGGKNADYIPYLANIDSKLFGLSICLMNGQTINIGDTDYRFGIESVSKVHTAILILRQYGAQKVLDMIGADATGLPFNSIIAILLENDHPSTPLVNAGAISACSMVQPVGNSDKKWDAIVQNVTELCGSAPQLIDELYKSETATNFNNRSTVSDRKGKEGQDRIAEHIQMIEESLIFSDHISFFQEPIRAMNALASSSTVISPIFSWFQVSSFHAIYCTPVR